MQHHSVVIFTVWTNRSETIFTFPKDLLGKLMPVDWLGSGSSSSEKDYEAVVLQLLNSVCACEVLAQHSKDRNHTHISK